MDLDALVAELTERYGNARDEARAGPMADYLRHQFAFIGLGSQARRTVDRAVLAGRSAPTEADLRELALRCWAQPEREYQYFAVEYLRRWVPKLPASEDFLGTAEALIRSKSWWDTVDELAAHVVGPLVLLHPTLVLTMDDWIDSPDLWIARTAILHQLAYKDRTDADRLFAYCLRRASERDFFIRKAIGWALRQYSRVDEEAVRGFVAANSGSLSPLSCREALVWLSRRDRRPPAPATRT